MEFGRASQPEPAPVDVHAAWGRASRRYHYPEYKTVGPDVGPLFGLDDPVSDRPGHRSGI